MMKTQMKFGAAATAFLTLMCCGPAALLAEHTQDDNLGYTDKNYHGDGDPYKHRQNSYTSPFDYGSAGEYRPPAPAPEPQGRCNCFTFDARKSHDLDKQKLTVMWDFGDGQTSDQPVVKHCYDQAGDYTVKLTVKDGSGQVCDTGMASARVSANFPPTAEAGEDMKACVGEMVSFDASKSTASSGNAKYLWDFGDGQTGEGVRISHAYEKSGNYRASLTVDDLKNTECSVARDSLAVSVMDRAAVQLSLKDEKDSACVNKPLNFHADGSGGSLKYHWDFGDGATWDGGSSASHAYSKAGTYTVAVTADNGQGSGCSVAADQVSVKIYERPVADAGDNLVCCTEKDNVFDGSRSTGSNLSYHWDFGDGESAEGARVTHAYQKNGNYRVILTVKDDSGSECSMSSDSFVASVNTQPEAVIEVR